MYLEVKDLKKSYGAGEGFVQALPREWSREICV